MELEVGKAYRCKDGVLFQVDSLDPNGEFQFCMLHPETKERTNYSLEGESKQLPGWLEDVGAKEVDLKSYEATGLVK